MCAGKRRALNADGESREWHMIPLSSSMNAHFSGRLAYPPLINQMGDFEQCQIVSIPS